MAKFETGKAPLTVCKSRVKELEAELKVLQAELAGKRKAVKPEDITKTFSIKKTGTYWQLVEYWLDEESKQIVDIIYHLETTKFGAINQYKTQTAVEVFA